jgi:hypothetical protein
MRAQDLHTTPTQLFDFKKLSTQSIIGATEIDRAQEPRAFRAPHRRRVVRDLLSRTEARPL